MNVADANEAEEREKRPFYGIVMEIGATYEFE